MQYYFNVANCFIAQLSKALDLKPHMLISQSMWFESLQCQSPLGGRITIPFILKLVDKIVAPAMHWVKVIVNLMNLILETG